MIRMAQEAGASSSIVEAVVAVNTATKSRMVTKIEQAMGGTVAGKSIAVLGLTFKPETDDMRDAPSLTILPALLDQGAAVKAHDPQGMDEARKELPETIAYMDNIEDTVKDADIFVTTTGNKDVIRIEHMRDMKDMAIVGNIGHFDNEIQVAALSNHEWTNIKDQVDMITFPSGNRMILLSQGRLLNLGNATGHPSFVMSASFTNQVLAQIELWEDAHAKTKKYENKVYMLPKHLDEKVARLHLEKIGVKLTEMSQEQADYIGVEKDGPYKPEHYRY